MISRLKDLNLEVFEALQVATIIAKFLTTWNDCRKILLHTSEDLTLDQLFKYIRIEEETQICENNSTLESGNTSKVNSVESKKAGNKSGKNFSKRKQFEMSKDEPVNNNKKNKSYFFYGRKGH